MSNAQGQKYIINPRWRNGRRPGQRVFVGGAGVNPKKHAKRKLRRLARRAAESAALILLLAVPALAHAEPYSCQMYREAARKCAYNTIGKCYVEAEMERLRKQCIRDGGNP